MHPTTSSSSFARARRRAVPPSGTHARTQSNASDAYDAYDARKERTDVGVTTVWRALSPFVALCLCVVLALAVRSSLTRKERTNEFSAFFGGLDGDGDGELTAVELSRYFREGVGGGDLDTSSETSTAAAAAVAAIDGLDDGDTVSLAELTASAQKMLSSREVGAWVRYGLGMPEHATSFVEHGITTLDFPSFLAKDGSSLKRLGVLKESQRLALTRAMKKQLLHVGRAPSAPRSVNAITLKDDDSGGVSVSWKRPKDLGTPKVHAYVVQSGSGLGKAVFSWTDVETVDGETFAVKVDGYRSGKYKFRVVAWNEYGASDPHKAVSAWVACGDVSGGGWVGAIISIGFVVRVVAAARNVIRRSLLFALALMRVFAARVQGADKHLEDFMQPEPSSPVATGIDRDKAPFTPTKALEHMSSMASTSSLTDDSRLTPMNQLKSIARRNLEEEEFCMGAGGSDGFAPVHDELVSKHMLDSFMCPDADDDCGLDRNHSIKKCSHPDCTARWTAKTSLAGKRVVRHFCGMCQSWFCEKHTRVSPHGSRGRCKPESRCICLKDFLSLTKEQQRELDSDNKYSLAGGKMRASFSTRLAKGASKIVRRKSRKSSMEAIDSFELRYQPISASLSMSET